MAWVYTGVGIRVVVWVAQKCAVGLKERRCTSMSVGMGVPISNHLCGGLALLWAWFLL